MRAAVPAFAIALAMIVVLLASPAAAGACARASASAHEDGPRATARAVRCLVNAERTKRGLHPLKPSGRLLRSARAHSKDMVARRYFSHVSPGGADVFDRVRRRGYLRGARSFSLAENIGWGGGSLGTAASLVRGWMRSSGHRANILRRDMRHIGVGIAAGTPAGPGGTTGTLVFGRRR